ncbi:MAG: ATP-binding protein [Chloroflexota bacterium]
MQTDDVIRLDVPATHKYLNLVSACVGEMLSRLDNLPEMQATIYNLQLAVQECCANIVDHAYDESDGRLLATLTLVYEPRRMVIELHDNGRPFEPEIVPQPTLDEPQIRGYGLFLMRELLDEVDYFPEPGDNRWRLVKLL